MEQIRVTFPNGTSAYQLPRRKTKSSHLPERNKLWSPVHKETNPSRLPKWKSNLSHLHRITSSSHFRVRITHSPPPHPPSPPTSSHFHNGTNLNHLPERYNFESPSQKEQIPVTFSGRQIPVTFPNGTNSSHIPIGTNSSHLPKWNFAVTSSSEILQSLS